ncbi:MAG: aldo/keto reductase, partial [Anaerolineae bacterium]|nr:aldo/keto reductase [Anaerolineae bacterium]
ILREIDGSRERLQTDVIDLYYIHWPRTGKDLRPLMDGLEKARAQGKIGAGGVSNFSVAQMEQIASVGRIDAHQMGYHLLWRFPERDVIPYCAAHGIAVVTYASLAHGILAGKLPRHPQFPAGDQRRIISLLREDVWDKLYEPVEAMKAVAERSGRPLAHLAIRWLLHRAAVTAVLVSARNTQQAAANAQALDESIDESVFAELTTISDRAMQYVPDEGNPYGYHP